MVIKYKTGYGEKISQVEIEKETDSSVWIRGSRSAKKSEYAHYHDSWEAAKQHLVGRAESKLARARLDLERAQNDLGNAKGLKP